MNIPQTEIDIVTGNFPREVHFYVRTFPIEKIPTSQAELIHWCQEAWTTKENLLKNFYAENVFSLEVQSNPRELYEARSESIVRCILYVFLIGWTVLLIFMLYFFYYSSFVRWYCLCASVFYTVITTSYCGVDILQTKILDWHKDKSCWPRQFQQSTDKHCCCLGPRTKLRNKICRLQFLILMFEAFGGRNNKMVFIRKQNLLSRVKQRDWRKQKSVVNYEFLKDATEKLIRNDTIIMKS